MVARESSSPRRAHSRRMWCCIDGCAVVTEVWLGVVLVCLMPGKRMQENDTIQQQHNIITRRFHCHCTSHRVWLRRLWQLSCRRLHPITRLWRPTCRMLGSTVCKHYIKITCNVLITISCNLMFSAKILYLAGYSVMYARKSWWVTWYYNVRQVTPM